MDNTKCTCGHDELAHYQNVIPCQGDQGHCLCPTFNPHSAPDE